MQTQWKVVLVVLGLGVVLAVVAGPGEAAPEERELWDKATLYFEPLPEVAGAAENPVTEAKVELGRRLYFDPRLSHEETISCNSCHQLANFGVDGLPLSPGDKGQLGGRNSPTVLNAALHGSQFWDGRAKDVEEQAGMPVTNPVEMAIPSEEFLVERLSAVKEYPALFAAAFPDEARPLSYRNIRLALGAFERTLLTPAPFDAYLKGDMQALGVHEKDGLWLFFDLGCTSCHNGVNVGAGSFRKFGLNAPYWEHTKSEEVDEGRLAVTGDEEDRYVFRVASLRNVARTAPYFHDGSVERLDEALKVMVALQIGMELQPDQLRDLTAFLESLTGTLDPAVRQDPFRATGG